jgi:HEAT repeat protein
VAVEERSFVSLIPQFFIFPLLLVVIAVMIYVFFVAPAQEERPISAMLTEIHHSMLPQSKNRAAYDLAIRARELEKNGQTMSADETRQLVDLLNKSADDDKLRRYLVCALGRAGEKKQAFTVLLQILESPGVGDKGKVEAITGHGLEERIEAITGLGLCRDRIALDPLIAQLENFDGAEDWEPRQITLSALANIVLAPDATNTDRARVAGVLGFHLDDPHWMVRWNTACILAEYFHDNRGFATLRNMLDRQYLGEHVSKPGDQDPWLVRALVALTACDAQKFCGNVDQLTKDSSFPVRNAVFAFRKKLCGDT